MDFDFSKFGVKPLPPEEIERQLVRAKVDCYNKTTPKEPDGLGIPCTRCNERGDIAVQTDAGTFAIAPCPVCGSIRKTAFRLKRQGLWERAQRLTLDSFQTNSQTQRTMRNTAEAFLEAPESHWLAILGQSGAGKTHLCVATFVDLCRRTGLDGQYMRWVQDGRLLKSQDFDGDDEMRHRFMSAPILYIDDFWKNRDGEKPTAADARLAYELLDSRYNGRKPTIISSEWTLDNIFQIDQAIGGRIREMCGPYLVNISKDTSKNFRLQ